jgi:hypothetical protein
LSIDPSLVAVALYVLLILAGAAALGALWRWIR